MNKLLIRALITIILSCYFSYSRDILCLLAFEQKQDIPSHIESAEIRNSESESHEDKDEFDQPEDVRETEFDRSINELLFEDPDVASHWKSFLFGIDFAKKKDKPSVGLDQFTTKLYSAYELLANDVALESAESEFLSLLSELSEIPKKVNVARSALAGLLGTYLARKQYDKAIEKLNEIVQQYRQNRRYYSMLLPHQCYFYLFKEAIKNAESSDKRDKYLRDSVKINSITPLQTFQLFLTAWESEKDKKLKENYWDIACKHYWKLKSEYQATLKRNVSEIRQKEGKTLTRAQTRQIVEKIKSAREAVHNLMHLYAHARQWEKAVKTYLDYQELWADKQWQWKGIEEFYWHPTNPEKVVNAEREEKQTHFHFELAWLYVKMGLTEDAKKEYKKAVEIAEWTSRPLKNRKGMINYPKENGASLAFSPNCAK